MATVEISFKAPKVKRPKVIYKYESEAKALVGKFFADGNCIGEVIKAEKHRSDHTWRCWFRPICAKTCKKSYYEDGEWKDETRTFLCDDDGLKVSCLLLPNKLMTEYREATQEEFEVAKAISEGAAIALQQMLEDYK